LNFQSSYVLSASIISLIAFVLLRLALKAHLKDARESEQLNREGIAYSLIFGTVAVIWLMSWGIPSFNQLQSERDFYRCLVQEAYQWEELPLYCYPEAGRLRFSSPERIYDLMADNPDAPSYVRGAMRRWERHVACDC